MLPQLGDVEMMDEEKMKIVEEMMIDRARSVPSRWARAGMTTTLPLEAGSYEEFCTHSLFIGHLV